jgi:hypothetical protein
MIVGYYRYATRRDVARNAPRFSKLEFDVTPPPRSESDKKSLDD